MTAFPINANIGILKEIESQQIMQKIVHQRARKEDFTRNMRTFRYNKEMIKTMR